jgi:hypothetical protein
MGSHTAGRLAGFSVCAAFLAGCSSADTGVLGNGRFRYVCSAGGSDLGCMASSDQDLPGAIAVGAKFEIAYAPNSGIGGVVEGESGYNIIAASSALANTTANTIVALRSGYVALLAEHVGKSTVDDFVHLKFSPIQTLRRPGGNSLTLSAGEAQVISLEPLDPIGAVLAGQIPCQWLAASGPQFVMIDPNAVSRSASVRGVAGGMATVRATCVNATVDIAVTVRGSPPAGTTADAGTMGDAGTAGDAGMAGDTGTTGDTRMAGDAGTTGDAGSTADGGADG